jgi:hypothetical protein
MIMVIVQIYILYCPFFFIYFYLLHKYIWLVLRSFTVSSTLYMFYCFSLFIMIVYVHIAPIL